MYLEHLIYSTAFALLLSLAVRRYHRTDYSWLIILFGYAPDVDVLLRVASFLSRQLFGESLYILGRTTDLHMGLHTLGALMVFSLILTFLLYPFQIPYLAGFSYGAMAYGVHLFCDALVYAKGYALLWPFSTETLGFGFFGTYQRDFLGIADTSVLMVGVLFLVFMLILWKITDTTNNTNKVVDLPR